MLTRNGLLTGAVALVAPSLGCTAPASQRPGASVASTTSVPSAPSRILLAYFSRPGENYANGGRVDLAVGNTETLATMIAARVDCTVHRIEAAVPYSEDYDATVARNVREQNSDARPGIANDPPNLDTFSTVLLASPIWNVRPPMIMRTFTEALNWDGVTVHPVTTHAMSGLGTTERDYGTACRGARLSEGLAVRGEEVADAGPAIDRWLRSTRLLPT